MLKILKLKVKLITFGIIAIIVLLVSVCAYFYINYSLMSYFILKKAKHDIKKIVADSEYDMVDYQKKYVGEMVPNSGGTFEGVRGFGLNMLLINNIKNESYIKEMLSLYSGSANGAYDKQDLHVPLEILLAMNANESGYYGNKKFTAGNFDITRIIPKSLLPFDGGRIVWNEPYKGYPAESMTLKGLNSNMTSLGLESDPINNGIFKNSFQIAGKYFSDSRSVSNLNGYQMSSRYSGDENYLPDSLAYLDWAYSDMVGTYKVPEDPIIRNAMFGVYHNGGSGLMQQYLTLGVRPGENYLKFKSSDMTQYYSNSVEPFTKFEGKYDTYSLHVNVDRGYGVAVWALLEDGYYLADSFFDQLGSKLSQITVAYNLIYGKKLSSDAVLGILKSHNKNPWEVDGYISQSDFYRIYGNEVTAKTSYNKGTIFKWQKETSPLYANKLKGEDPRVLVRMNTEVAGYMWDAVDRGKWIYGNMLAYTGVDIDPTNPEDYLEDLEDGEFNPGPVGDNGVPEKLLWPAPGNYRVTSQFGYRKAPTAGASTFHQGIDIGVPVGSKVVAVYPGKVYKVSSSSARGKYILLDHGTFMTRYQHLSESLVHVGDEVEAGQEIAKSGNTGIGSGAHLHFEVLTEDLRAMDPYPYIKGNQIK